MNAVQSLKKSPLGIELVRLLAAEGDRIFSTDRARELAPRVGLKDGYLWEALYHLRRNGWIVSLRRGLYALSPTVPGITAAHELEIAMALTDPAAISHWSALHHHGLTEQVPRRVFVLTTTGVSVPRRRGTRAKEDRQGFHVGDTTYQFVQVRPERYFGTEKVWIGEARVTITDPERTLLDGLTMPQYCGDFAEVLHAFEARGADLDLRRIVDYALKLDAATAKRLGWVLQHQGVDSSELERLIALPIKGYRKLDPTGPRKGPCDARWMIQENLPWTVRGDPERRRNPSIEVKRIVSRDSEVHSGDLVFAGTRIPVDALVDYLKGGHSIDEFLQDFPTVERWQVEAYLDLSPEGIDHLRTRGSVGAHD